MVAKIIALNFASRAEIPNPGFAGNLGASGAGSEYLTLSVRTGWAFIDHAGNLIRVKRIARKA
jgi:hypothetical protein